MTIAKDKSACQVEGSSQENLQAQLEVAQIPHAESTLHAITYKHSCLQRGEMGVFVFTVEGKEFEVLVSLEEIRELARHNAPIEVKLSVTKEMIVAGRNDPEKPTEYVFTAQNAEFTPRYDLLNQLNKQKAKRSKKHSRGFGL